MTVYPPLVTRSSITERKRTDNKGMNIQKRNFETRSGRKTQGKTIFGGEPASISKHHTHQTINQTTGKGGKHGEGEGENVGANLGGGIGKTKKEQSNSG